MAKRKSGDDPRVNEDVRGWLNEIAAAKRREKDYRQEGRRIRQIYDGTKKETTPFNILFSNTETIAPSLYSAVPRPVVQRRYKDDDPVGLAAAKAGERMLEFLLDTNIDGYETFDQVMVGATMDGLLPGRGVSTLKYDYEGGADENDPVRSEMVCPETVSWDRVYFGYARKWSAVPWVAYEKQIDKKEATRLFGADVARKIAFTKGEERDEDEGGRKSGTSRDDRDQGERETALIYQIWDKEGGRKVRWVSTAYTEGYLKVDEDPLELTGFFNCPKPLQFVIKTDDNVPTALYTLYENQAKELNNLTIRISKLVKAIKARGIYDSELGGDIENLMESEENTLVPAEKSSSLAAEKGLQNAIWFMPIEQMVNALRELYAARQEVKQTIYEIMGISDILRGASKASETLGAQKIKNTWGSLRLKPKQAEVQRYARDMLRMMLEIATLKFSDETWARMTGLPFLTAVQEQQAQSVMQAAQAAAQSGDQAAMQTMQQMQEQMKGQISWQQVLGVLRDDMQRAYRIDIETNSTVEPEAVEDQKNISDLMNSIGTFLQGAGPMIAQGVLPFETAQSMLLAITRRFKFGSEIEEQIKNMAAPKGEEGQGGDPQAQADQQAAAAEQEKAKALAEIQKLQAQLNDAKLENAAIKRSAELDMRELSLRTDERLMKLQGKVANESLNMKKTQAMGQLSLKEQLLSNKVESAVAGAGKKGKKGAPPIPTDGPGPGNPPARDTNMQLASAIAELVASQRQLMQAAAAQAQQINQLAHAVSAPKRKRAIRGPDGRIAESIEEIIPPGTVQ